jgi:hypothetical protein
MVGRANVFLSIKYSDDVAAHNPFNDGSLEPRIPAWSGGWLRAFSGGRTATSDFNEWA